MRRSGFALRDAARAAGVARRAARLARRAGPAACAVLAVAVAAPAAAAAVTVSPLPGTPDAMPDTQVSILGTSPSNIASVSVTGTVSGVHTGHLESYSDGQGASFLLDSPLSEGEQVSVVVDLREGAPVEDSFGVARLAPPEGLLLQETEKPEDLEHFRTEPELRPPKVKINLADPTLEGDFFLDPLPAPVIHVGAKLLEFEPVGPNGLMILDPEGKLVWWDQLPTDEVAADLQKITWEGRPALSWWQGRVTEAAYGLGEGVIANSSYEPVAHVRAGNGLQADIHELQVMPGGQAYIDADELECLPECDASHPPVLDGVVQEIDVATGLVMWEWHAMSYIPDSESEVAPANGVWDPYHVNSIQQLPEEHLLISMRDTSGVYDVDQQTGQILWQIDPRHSSFAMDRNTVFHFQHDARLEGKRLNMLTLFDDEAGPPVYGRSRGLILKVGEGKVRMVHQYLRPVATVAPAEGSMQVMRHGEAMVGFGATPYFSEFTRSGGAEKRGKMIFDAELPKGDGTYRVLRYTWEGMPHTLPKLLAERESPSEVSLYASWNGASKVASWEVLAGEEPGALAPAGSYPWSGFETQIQLPSAEKVFEVRALDAAGHVLATSEPSATG